MTGSRNNDVLFRPDEPIQGHIVVQVDETDNEEYSTGEELVNEYPTAKRHSVLSDFFANQDAEVLRKKTGFFGVLLAILCAISLCFVVSNRALESPIEVISCYLMWIQETYKSLVSPVDALTAAEILELHPSYYQITSEFTATIITAVSGVLLALAGTLYQNVFRNPIASPSMLGVSSGIELGIVLLVCVFGAESIGMYISRYVYCYIAVFAVLAIIFVLSKLMSTKGQPAGIINILLVAMLISSLIEVAISYLSSYNFDDDMWDAYSNLMQVLGADTTITGILVVLVSSLISIAPILLLRFRLNMLSFGINDMRMQGINPTMLRGIALVCGTIMMVTAQLAVGAVAMISLVVPNISRAWYGAEFRRQFLGNCLIGACLLVLCRIISMCIPFVGGSFPVSVVVSFVVFPIFVWIVATSQRGWD